MPDNEVNIHNFLISLKSDLKKTYEDDKDNKFEYWRGFAESAGAFYAIVEAFLKEHDFSDSRK